jgi:hypothetical protein
MDGNKINNLSLGSIIVGVIGILIGFFSYLHSIERREPIFKIDPSRIRILYSNNISRAAIKVFKIDGQEVRSDLSILKIYFWNKGKKSIRPEDVLSPLIISMPDSLTNILDARLVKLSRPITGVELNFSDSLKKSIEIKFNILEKNDGGIINLLYEGKYDSPLLVNGIIENFGNVSFSTRKLDFTNPKWIRILVDIVGIGLLVLVAWVSFITVLNAIKEWGNYKKKDEGKLGEIIGKTVGFSTLFIGLLILAFYLISRSITALYIPSWLI